MKKIFTGIVAAAVMLSMVSCGTGKVDDGRWDYKTGVAAYTRAGASYGTAAGDTDKVTSTIVAAVFDSEGKIVKVKIDEVEARPGAAGEIISKKELGDDYGMKAVSSIGKEWHQQVTELEKWLEGKDISRLTSTITGKMGEYMRGNSRPSGAADEYTVRNGDGTTGGTMPDSAMADSAKDNSAGSMMNSSSTAADSGTVGDMVDNVTDGINSAIDNMTDGGKNETGTTAGIWADEDLRAMVTIDTSGIQTALQKAWRNAK